MSLSLHELHHGLGARFGELNGAEIVADYGDWPAEHAALRAGAGVIDLSFRSRICLTGADRARFLHGQVTNDVKKLRAGEGCYAAVTTAKGKMESDLNIFALADELLLDFEPGLTEKISARLEKFIVADDVQIVDVAPHYGLLSVQGPKAEDVVRSLNLFPEIPAKLLASMKISDATLGEIYLANNPRLGTSGFDLFVPDNSLGAAAINLSDARPAGRRLRPRASKRAFRDSARTWTRLTFRSNAASKAAPSPTPKAATLGRKSSIASTASATSTGNCAVCGLQMI
jgi:glycine cleavage system aminomethyltransferase T